MREMMENMSAFLPSIKSNEASALIRDVKAWSNKLEPVKYTCLGCKHCFPAAATNLLMSEFPSAELSSPSCDFEAKEDKWPPVSGEYFVFGKDGACSVAVSTLTSVKLAETLAKIKPDGLCIVGKTETENIGIDKVIKNTITNPSIRWLIVAGQDSPGHYSGATLLALSNKGVNREMKVIGSPGRRPVLKNVALSEVAFFRRQVQVIDMIGCEDAKKVIAKINELLRKTISNCGCKECAEPTTAVRISSVPKIPAGEPKKLKMDKAGYFVVIPSLEKKIIIVEHYAYDNRLLHIIEGKNAPAIYSTIIENGWITELGHAAYLGRELAKAEFSLKKGPKYIQDRAPGKVECVNNTNF